MKYKQTTQVARACNNNFLLFNHLVFVLSGVCVCVCAKQYSWPAESKQGVLKRIKGAMLMYAPAKLAKLDQKTNKLAIPLQQVNALCSVE